MRQEISQDRNKKNSELLVDLKTQMTPSLIRAVDLAQMKGASIWLSALPLTSENFVLNKQEFMDAICLRYRWSLKRLPTQCPYGKLYDMDGPCDVLF